MDVTEQAEIHFRQEVLAVIDLPGLLCTGALVCCPEESFWPIKNDTHFTIDQRQ